MKHADELTRLLKRAHQLGADAADCILYDATDISLSRRMGKQEGLERSESSAVGLRVFVGQSQAIVSSNDRATETLDELAERGVAMARLAPPDADAKLAETSLHPQSIPDLDLEDTQEPDHAWLTDQCKRCEEAAMSVKGITNSEGADASYSRYHTTLAIAKAGQIQFMQGYGASHFSLSTSVLAGSDTAMERDYDFTSAHHRADLQPPETVGLSAGERTIRRLNPHKAATCQVPVVFDPRVSKQLLGILASAISGAAVARGSSFLKDDMGKSIFPKHVTIIDDPHIKRGHGSRPFDAEGVKNAHRALVENGTLQSWLLDLRSASKLGLATTGHASRGITSAPSPSSTNLFMQPGKLSPKELMADIKSGFYVTETFGMGVNTTTGDYSQGATGFWIEKGEIAYPVSEITIAGRLRDMFLQLTPANDLIMRYAANAPTVRIETMTVAGT